MQALFVHGMGRSPLSGWRLLMWLRAEGITTHAFGYAATFQDFASISQRLAEKIDIVAARGDYVLIGHSLGGVLLRAAASWLPAETRHPHKVFLLGSPVRPVRLAQKFQRNWIYRVLAGDCGQLLASHTRMAQIQPCRVPTTSILGTGGWEGRLSAFPGELNDGIVSISEASAEWIAEEIHLPLIHTYMPSNRHVARIILERIGGVETGRAAQGAFSDTRESGVPRLEPAPPRTPE
jgi:pimeloyl-ACP methyl ester carboxylesterase